jgi:hypothetical protein
MAYEGQNSASDRDKSLRKGYLSFITLFGRCILHMNIYAFDGNAFFVGRCYIDYELIS